MKEINKVIISANTRIEVLLSNSQLKDFITKDLKRKRNANTHLKVTFSNGEMLEEQFANHTFVKTIEKIGVRKVMNLGFKRFGVPLIDNNIHKKYWKSQVQIGLRFYIQTQGSTKDKKKILENISDCLNLGLKVEIVPNN